LELYGSLEYFDRLVPHEYNHMVRNAAVLTEEIGRGLPTLKQLTVSEGLATLFPVVLRGEPVTPLSIVAGGMMAEESAHYCRAHEDEVFAELRRVWDRPITPDLIAQFISGSGDGCLGDRPAKSAYYVGSRIVGDLLNDGHDLCRLTRMPTEAILQLHSESVGHR